MLLALALPALAAAPCGTVARLAAHGGRPPAAEPRAPRAVGGACIDPQLLAREDDVRGDFTETFATTRVLLAWDPANPAIDEAWVQLYADAFDRAWEVQIDQLGWRAPDELDTCLMTVLLADFPDAKSGTGAWTNVMADGDAPYMVFNTDWQTDGEAVTETTVYHEFNHASQFGYGVYWAESDWWYWEATAEWVPDLVDDDANTYTWSLWTYLDLPYLALDSQVGTAAYGHFVFNEHLEAAYGVDTPRLLWEAATSRDHVSMTVESVLGAGSFREAVTGMAAHAAAMDVAEADVWAEAMEEFDVDPYTAHVTEAPAEGDVESGRGAPQQGGQGFLHVAGLDGEVTIALTLATDVDGTDPDWVVSLATVDADGVVTYETHEPDGSLDLTVGDEVADAYVALTPMGEIGSSGAGWSWSVTVGDPAVADEGDDPALEEESAGGCACGTSGGVPSGLTLLVGLAALRRRRR